MTYFLGEVPVNIEAIVTDGGSILTSVVAVAVISLLTFVAFRFIRKFVK